MEIDSDFTPEEFKSLTPQEKGIVMLAAIFVALKHLPCEICGKNKGRERTDDGRWVCNGCGWWLRENQAE
jgi:hypothetical protein